MGEVLALNRGIPFDRAAWTYVGFKGGSELGVLNLTWLLRRADGRWFVLTLGLNEPAHAFDQGGAFRLIAPVASLLARAD